MTELDLHCSTLRASFESDWASSTASMSGLPPEGGVVGRRVNSTIASMAARVSSTTVSPKVMRMGGAEASTSSRP